MPLVSVIIPAHNRTAYIIEAIESVLGQTFRDFEIIVVDDGSTEDIKGPLSKWIDRGEIQYVYQSNQGQSAARNLGVSLAKGKYFAFLDDDDMYLPTKLEKQVAFLEAHPEVGLVHTGFTKFNNDSDDLGYRDTSRFSGWIYPEILLQWSVLIKTSTTLLPARVIEKVGQFDPSIKMHEDLDFWRRISRHYPIMALPERLCKVRVHEGNISGDKIVRPETLLVYLTKAFDDDPQLSAVFKRRVLAAMFRNAGQNILGEGEATHMKLVREYSIKSIIIWPLQFSAYLGYMGSFLSYRVRVWLFDKWHHFRYRRTN